MLEIQITDLVTKEKFYSTSESHDTVEGDISDWFERWGIIETDDYEILVL